MGIIEDMEAPLCMRCVHKNEFDLLCKAYPFGIPQDILLNRVLHNEVREDQFGDFIFTEE